MVEYCIQNWLQATLTKKRDEANPTKVRAKAEKTRRLELLKSQWTMAPCEMIKGKIRAAIEELDASKLPAAGARVAVQRAALQKVLAAKFGVGTHADLTAFLAHVDEATTAAGVAAVAGLESRPSAAAPPAEAPVQRSAGAQLEMEAARGE